MQSGRLSVIIIIIIIILLLVSFSHQRYLVVFHKSLCESKSPQVSTTLLSILADLNNCDLIKECFFKLIIFRLLYFII